MLFGFRRVVVVISGRVAGGRFVGLVSRFLMSYATWIVSLRSIVIFRANLMFRCRVGTGLRRFVMLLL